MPTLSIKKRERTPLAARVEELNALLKIAADVEKNPARFVRMDATPNRKGTIVWYRLGVRTS